MLGNNQFDYFYGITMDKFHRNSNDPISYGRRNNQVEMTDNENNIHRLDFSKRVFVSIALRF